MHIQTYIQKVIQKENLSRQQTHMLLLAMMQGEISPVQIGSLLTALSMKGETREEITGFIQTMREQMTSINGCNAIDVCGTGGDGKNAFNISTAVAFVVAGAGVPVAKHGNRAASSTSGSADVLEVMGVKIDVTPTQAEQILQKTGMVFLFAPLFHTSMKQVSLVRKELQIRTIFNFLGPFANPAGVKRQLVGVSNTSLAKIFSNVATHLAYDHLIIATTEDQFDEISITVASDLYEIKQHVVTKQTITPEQFGFHRAHQDTLLGGSAKENAAIITEILDGKKGPKCDIVLLNSGVALYVSGIARTIEEGILLARESIHNGYAKKILIRLIKETQRYA